MYSIIGDGSKIHMASTFLLAQEVERDLGCSGYHNVGVISHGNVPPGNEIVELFMGQCESQETMMFSVRGFNFNIKVGNWLLLKNMVPKWKKKSVDLKRSYFKIYGPDIILCLDQEETNSFLFQFEMRKSELDERYNLLEKK